MDSLLNFLDSQSLYTFANTINCLYSIGLTQPLLRAPEKIDQRQGFYHKKLLVVYAVFGALLTLISFLPRNFLSDVRIRKVPLSEIKSKKEVSEKHSLPFFVRRKQGFFDRLSRFPNRVSAFLVLRRNRTRRSIPPRSPAGSKLASIPQSTQEHKSNHLFPYGYHFWHISLFQRSLKKILKI